MPHVEEGIANANIGSQKVSDSISLNARSLNLIATGLLQTYRLHGEEERMLLFIRLHTSHSFPEGRVSVQEVWQ